MRSLRIIFSFSIIVFSAPLQAAEQDLTSIVSRIKRLPVESRALAAIGYSKRLHALEIEFVNGAIYRYLNVPPSLHRKLLSDESKARFYHANIRGKFLSLRVRKWRVYHRQRPSLGLEWPRTPLYNGCCADPCPHGGREESDLLCRARVDPGSRDQVLSRRSPAPNAGIA